MNNETCFTGEFCGNEEQTDFNQIVHSFDQLPALPADYGDFVRQEYEDGGERDRGRQDVATEEVEGDSCPAKTCCDKGTDDVLNRDFERKRRALNVSEPENLAEGSDDDQELNRDTEPRPTFSGHGKIVTAALKTSS